MHTQGTAKIAFHTVNSSESGGYVQKNEDYDKHFIEYCKHFQRRGYPPALLERAALSARRLNRTDLLSKKQTPTKETERDKIVMVTRLHPDHDTLRNLVTKNTTTHIFMKRN